MKDNSKFNPSDFESKWYKHWLDLGYFNSKPDEREPYTIVIPPPNVTGVLHMGHMLNNTLQDVLIRKARMQGYNTCWVPGTDHASIATEAKVVEKLAKDGINKNDLTRSEFLNHALDWKNKHGGIILEQLKKIGASCDWNRTKFTMDNDMSQSVIKVFVDLYDKGLIYRGIRMVNWDPEAQTALSDEEVIYKEVKSTLYYIKYNIKDSKQTIVVATTRPETILGDSAICVNPNDKRYTSLKGQKAIIPLLDREVPIIFDNYVDMDFGTGVLKITPAHDINDYQIGDKHNLETIDILNDDGTLNDNAGLYVGKDRFVVREEIAIDLESQGYLIKKEEYQNNIGFSERTNSVIEPKLSMQWFCKMKDFSKPALDHVMNNDVIFHPEKFKNTYRHWMENIKDWCVSRQLWWGQQIPAFYYDGNKFVVAETKEEAVLKLQKENPNITIDDLRQDEDVLDTWFSSWLWPISVFDGINNPDNEEVNYYYPTNDLVTAPEILFFWVARMIMAGYEYKGEMPFKNVYLTGIVRDKKGRKMSKSLGNSPDPIQLIEKYGADGVRVGMLLCSPAGNDLPFDETLCEQGRNFSNKIWNAFKLINSWSSKDIVQPQSSVIAINWFDQKINKSILELNNSFSKYRISESLMIIYKLVWDDFCSCYLEIIKPSYQEPIDKKTYNSTILFFEKILKLLHPFMPFISEELWHSIDDRKEDIIVSDWPINNKYNQSLIEDFEIAMQVVSSIRNVRKQKNIPNRESISLTIKENQKINRIYDSIILKLSNISEINYTDSSLENSTSFLVGSNEYFIPLKSLINKDFELEKLTKELEYLIGFLNSVEKKLNNKNFMQNAPKNVIDIELKKQSDAKSKILVLEKQISNLK
ncbi:MAG: valine--tRNA ligase [Flavobacteriales bacterium]|nr:valine--tRNA ligase [Flavobacteriales bacterium]